jgi:hypothetical protein
MTTIKSVQLGFLAQWQPEKPARIATLILLFYLRQGLSKYERFDLRLSIGGELERLAGRETDVVDMEAVPKALLTFFS